MHRRSHQTLRAPAFLATLLVLASTAAARGPLLQEAPVAFVGARVLTMGPDGMLEDATVIVQGGAIVAIGPATETRVPAGATVRDVAGKVLLPGLVDTHSHVGGGSGADGAAPIQPGVRILDSINARSSGIQRAQAGGITTANVMPGSGHLCSGQTVYLKYRDAGTIDGLVLRGKDGAVLGGLKMANGTNSQRQAPFPGTRGKSAALVRQAFLDAQAYQRELDAAAADPEVDPPARDLAKDALVEVLRRERVVHHHTHRHDDILTVLRLAEEFDFRVVLHHVSEGWKVADEIAAAGVPCSVIVVDSPGGKLEARDLRFETGAMLEKAGARVSFHTDDWITDSRHFLRSAALAVRAGMSRRAALEALTIEAARQLDLDDRIGSLEVGKDADLVVLDGDPLSIYTKVEETWIDGVKVFDRTRPQDRLWATGGFGAGHDTDPSCCSRQDWWQ